MKKNSPHKSYLDLYFDVDKNAQLALQIFESYYQAHNHSGKIYDNFPDFFMVHPEVFGTLDFVARAPEKASLSDVIQRAKARNGYIGVSKHRNPKLGYYWLELSVQPFMLGDAVTLDNKGEFFYVLTKFIAYTKQCPKMYGDLTAEIGMDKDVTLMYRGIEKMAARLATSLALYPENMLVAFDPKWPVSEVKKLLATLKHNEQEWCELFFEYIIYVMGKKSKA